MSSKYMNNEINERVIQNNSSTQNKPPIRQLQPWIDSVTNMDPTQIQNQNQNRNQNKVHIGGILAWLT